jgi:hypothetical protein
LESTLPSDTAILSRIQLFERVRARLGRDDEASRAVLLRLALAGTEEAGLLLEAARLRRLGVRARRRLGRGLLASEVAVLGARADSSLSSAPLLVTSSREAVAGDWLLIDASQQSVEITVPASALGDELRLRRRDASPNQALLVGAFTASLGPGHALLLKGEPDGAWGAW